MAENTSMISHAYVEFLRTHFALDWGGIHGASHWARVRANGLLLAEQTGADPKVVEIFAFVHDVERRSDGSDPDHGPRAADLAVQINSEFFGLTQTQLRWLIKACEGHSLGGTQGNPTVLTCWDADRLDLGRVGIKPIAEKLCTAAAREGTMIEWSYKRSILLK